MGMKYAPYGASVSFGLANRLVLAAMAGAARRAECMAVAVVDTAGTLVALGRMDDCHAGSVGACQDKARSAAMFRRPTAVFRADLEAGGEGLRVLTLRDACAVDGGIPLVVDGKIVGGMGVSGGAPKDDACVANEAASACGAQGAWIEVTGA